MKSPRIAGTLRARLLIILSLLSLPPFFAASWWGYERERKTIDEALECHLGSLAVSRSALIEERLERLSVLAESIVRGPDLSAYAASPDDEALRARAEQALAELQTRHWGLAHHWFLSNEEGRVVISPSGFHLGHEMARNAFFAEGMQKTTVTDFSAFEEANHFHQLLITPLPSDDDSPCGVLAIEICIDAQLALMSAPGDPDELEVRIATLDGHTIVVEKNEDSSTMAEEGIRSAVDKSDGMAFGLFDSKRRGPVVGAYHREASRPWVVAVELPEAVAYAPLAEAGRFIFGFAALGTLVILACCFQIASRISKPLVKMAQVAEGWGRGEISARMDCDRGDEIGALGRGLNEAMESMQETLTAMSDQSEGVSQLSRELLDFGRSTEASGTTTRERADTVADSGRTVAERMTQAEELVSLMSEKSRRIVEGVGEAAQVTETARSLAVRTNETVTRLGRTSRDVGQVIELIADVAGQTNLLALNATIEAARAGEAGKGFAVVAHEVKELATQTSRSATEISEKVGAIQRGVEESVAAIQEIAEVIERNSVLASSVVGLVEDQAASGDTIQAAVNEVAGTGRRIEGQGADAASSAEEMLGAAKKISGAAATLSGMAQELESHLGRFRP